jgi:hypothetical protein
MLYDELNRGGMTIGFSQVQTEKYDPERLIYRLFLSAFKQV